MAITFNLPKSTNKEFQDYHFEEKGVRKDLEGLWERRRREEEGQYEGTKKEREDHKLC